MANPLGIEWLASGVVVNKIIEKIVATRESRYLKVIIFPFLSQ